MHYLFILCTKFLFKRKQICDIDQVNFFVQKVRLPLNLSSSIEVRVQTGWFGLAWIIKF